MERATRETSLSVRLDLDGAGRTEIRTGVGFLDHLLEALGRHARFDLAVFAVASLVTRGARFYLVAALLRRYGLPIRGFIERYLTLVTTGMVLIIVGGFILVPSAM